MRCRHGCQQQRALAEIESRRFGDETARRHQRGGIAPTVEFGGEILDEEIATRLEVVSQARGADKLGAPFCKRGIAEHMIEMHVGVDDMADGLVGELFDGGTQGAPGGERPTGVDHRHAARADDHAEIGAVAARGVIDVRHLAVMHVDAGRDGRQKAVVRARARRRDQHQQGQ
jgi:hypothetical protein